VLEIEIKGLVEYLKEDKTVRKLIYRIGSEETLRELDISNYKIESEDDIYELADMLIQHHEAEQSAEGRSLGRLIGRKIGKKDIERWKQKKLQDEVEEWKTESSGFSEL